MVLKYYPHLYPTLDVPDFSFTYVDKVEIDWTGDLRVSWTTHGHLVLDTYGQCRCRTVPTLDEIVDSQPTRTRSRDWRDTEWAPISIMERVRKVLKDRRGRLPLKYHSPWNKQNK